MKKTRPPNQTSNSREAEGPGREREGSHSVQCFAETLSLFAAPTTHVERRALDDRAGQNICRMHEQASRPQVTQSRCRVVERNGRILLGDGLKFERRALLPQTMTVRCPCMENYIVQDSFLDTFQGGHPI